MSGLGPLIVAGRLPALTCSPRRMPDESDLVDGHSPDRLANRDRDFGGGTRQHGPCIRARARDKRFIHGPLAAETVRVTNLRRNRAKAGSPSFRAKVLDELVFTKRSRLDKRHESVAQHVTCYDLHITFESGSSVRSSGLLIFAAAPRGFWLSFRFSAV